MANYNNKLIDLMLMDYMAQQQVTDEDGEAIIIQNYIDGTVPIQEESIAFAGPSFTAAAAAASASVNASVSIPGAYAMTMEPAANHAGLRYPWSGQIMLGGSDPFFDTQEEEDIQLQSNSASTAFSTTAGTWAQIKTRSPTSLPSSPPSSPSPVESSSLSSSAALTEARSSLPSPPPSSSSTLASQEPTFSVFGSALRPPPVGTVNARQVELNPSPLLLQEMSRAAPSANFLAGYESYTGPDGDAVMRQDIMKSIQYDMMNDLLDECNRNNIADNIGINISSNNNGNDTNITTTNGSSRNKRKNERKRRSQKERKSNGNNSNDNDNNNNNNSGNSNSGNNNSDNNSSGSNDNINSTSSNDTNNTSSNDNIAGSSTKNRPKGKGVAARKKNAAKRKGKQRAVFNGADDAQEGDTAGRVSDSNTVAANNTSTAASSSSSPSHSNGTSATTPTRASDGSDDLADAASDRTATDDEAGELILPTPSGSMPSYVGVLRASARRTHSDSDSENATEGEDPEVATTRPPVLAQPRARPPRGHKKPRYAFVDGRWENVNGATVNGNRGIKAISPAQLQRKYGHLMLGARNGQSKTGQEDSEEDESEEDENDVSEIDPFFRGQYHDPENRDPGNPGLAIPCC